MSAAYRVPSALRQLVVCLRCWTRSDRRAALELQCGGRQVFKKDIHPPPDAASLDRLVEPVPLRRTVLDDPLIAGKDHGHALFPNDLQGFPDFPLTLRVVIEQVGIFLRGFKGGSFRGA